MFNKEIKNRAIFTKPNFELFTKLGLTSIDMHYHTRYSDTLTKVDAILQKAYRMGIGVAITDHNEIRGVLQAYKNRYNVVIVPGIEVSCEDGPHLLIYFYNVSELIQFHDKHIKPNLREDPWSYTKLKVDQLLDISKGYNCITSAAHPYGYRLSDLGLAKCVRKGYVDENCLNRVDALEVISGGTMHKLNLRAVMKAEEMSKPVTGGSDGHTLFELGRVVTSSYADDIETFLKNILIKKNYVIGTETKLIPKIFEAGKMLTKHMY
ncbi:MAG: PHP domain-containing protein, partial [Candidatus Woesearchaeota archaeon]